MMNRSLTAAVAAPIVASLALAAPLCAAELTGRVTTLDGKPAYGAMVTVFNTDRSVRETVYTAADGGYAIRTGFSGPVSVRARLSGWADASATPKGEKARLDLTLKPFADAESASAALSASAFNARLPWKNVARDRPAFISQCNYCHQLGNATTRPPLDHAQWLQELDKMEGLLAMPSARAKQVFADVLSRGFDGKPIEAVQTYGASPELARAKVREWAEGDAYTFIHDADIATDQKLYGADEGHDILWVLDRASGQIEKYPLPASNLPRGGKFSGMRLPIGVFSGKQGPHSMAQTSDGRIWITNALSSTLMSFDPKTKAFKTYPVGHDALYPHTVRVDSHDVVWFTIVASNQIGRFDPKTEQMTVMRLPSNGLIQWVSEMLFPTLMRIGAWFPDQAVHLNLSTHKLFGHAILPFPYGIDVDPTDGSVWYAKLYASKVGRIDPRTLKVQEWDTPMKGPRRPRFDNDGVLWIPAFDEGGLMRFDTRMHAFRTFKIPPVGKGEYETPYALNVDRKTGEIWMAANNSDRILRFFPRTSTFMSYPSPTRVTVLRDFSFASDGEVCSSSSNLPSYAIEGGKGGFICVSPDGGERDRAALAKGR